MLLVEEGVTMETYSYENVLQRVVNFYSQAQPHCLHGLEQSSPLSSLPGCTHRGLIRVHSWHHHLSGWVRTPAVWRLS